MTIDRHNYEEFFLLYIDNELNVDQKKQVEAFVLANSDLEEEFIMLQQSKLIADDDLVFDGKESLMKEESAIHLGNYEEWLLLYTDDELTSEQKLLVGQFAAEHPQVRQELDLLLQTKLEPQEIVFADKASLYRREEKVRVIKMTWWRVAAAAILVLAAGFGTYSIISNKNKASIADIAKGTTPVYNNPVQQKTTPGSSPSSTPQQTQGIANLVPNKSDNSVAVKQDHSKAENKKEVILPKQNENGQINHAVALNEVRQDNSTNAIVPPDINTSSTPIQKTNSTVSSLALNTTDASLPQQTINNLPVTKRASESPDYKLAKMTTVDDETASNSENKKLRGFFRKATRFIERTTKMNPANDDDKVLIGSVAVSLK